MTVSGFEYIEDLILRRCRGDSGKLFFVERDYHVFFRLDGQPTEYVVPKGTATDFASIPSIVPKWVADKMDSHIEAAVVHDRMCQDRKPYSSKVAADIFLAAMEAADVPFIRRRLMYRSVVMFGPQWSSGA